MQSTRLTYTQFRQCESLVKSQDDELQYLLTQLNTTIQTMPHAERIPAYVMHTGASSYKRTPPIATDPTDFKRTTSLTQITSMAKDMNAIRIQINKLTPGDTYGEMSIKSIEQLKCVSAHYIQQFNWEDVRIELCKIIYTACTLSTLFIEMYATFFDTVCTEIPELQLFPYLQQKIAEYQAEFYCAERVPVEEYDAFCRMTKRNDIRKQTSTFFTFLFKRKVILANQMLEMIQQLIQLIKTFLADSSKTEELEIATDNVTILIMHTQSRLSRSNENDWYDVLLPELYAIQETLRAKNVGNERIGFAWQRLIEIVEA